MGKAGSRGRYLPNILSWNGHWGKVLEERSLIKFDRPNDSATVLLNAHLALIYRNRQVCI